MTVENIVFKDKELFAVEATCKEDAVAEFKRDVAPGGNDNGKTTYYITVPIELTVHPRKVKAVLRLSAPNDPDVVEDIRSKLGKDSRVLLFSKCPEKNAIVTDKAMVGKWLVEATITVNPKRTEGSESGLNERLTKLESLMESRQALNE